MNSPILVIGTYRSGTQNFTNSISEHLKLIKLTEPWNLFLHPNKNHLQYKLPKDWYPNSYIVKSLITQLPIGWNGLGVDDVRYYQLAYPKKSIEEVKPTFREDIVSFYLDLIKKYKNVVILGRKDRVALAESYVRQLTFGKSNSWHTEYKIENPNKLYLNMKYFNTICDILEEISEKSGIPITWYEELYSGNVDRVKKVSKLWNFDIDVSKFMKYVDPKNRYRKF